MLSRICSTALLATLIATPVAFAQNTTANPTIVRNAVTDAVRAREAEEAARRNDSNGAVGEIGPLEVRPEDPEIDIGVYAPSDFTIPGYGTTQVSLRWWNRGGPQTRIHRSISNGPWTLLQTLGPQPTETYIDFLDQGASMNAENCYRVSVSDGVTNTLTSPIRCAFTRRDPDRTVSRLQLRIQIASAADADTDNTIEVRLQSPTNITYANTYWRPAGNYTWVDSTTDDFERSSERTYDLMLSNIARVSDITQITLVKPGGDDVCIAGLALIIDNATAFARTYGNSSSQCQWIRGDNALSINFAELRGDADWNDFSPNTFVGFDGAALRSVIEAKFGHFLHGRGELQNGRPVTTSFVNPNRLNVSVPVRVYDAPILGDVDSIVHFDLVISNANGATQLQIENVDADSSDFLAVVVPIIAVPVLNGVSGEIEAQIRGMGASSIGGSAPPGLTPCFNTAGGLMLCPDNG